MRLSRLDLLAYGPFTAFTVDLAAPSPGTPDLTLLVGPNEAGKSTTRAAIEDFLFGFPHRTTRDFLHPSTALRLGGVLERADEPPLAFVRRKGTKNIFLDPDGQPLPEAQGRLEAWLGGSDRDAFIRLFSLDSERLREGGQAMISGNGDLGQALFAAGAGLADLGQRLRALNDEAEKLWSPRKAAHRAWFQAEERLDAAKAALRAHTLNATDWQARRDAAEKAAQAVATLEADAREAGTTARRLARVRRVLRDVRALEHLNERQRALAGTCRLPADASARVEETLREAALLQARLDTLTAEDTRLARALAALAPDTGVLAQADALDALAERRIAVRAQAARVPALREALKAARAACARAAGDLGWPEREEEALRQRLPAPADAVVPRARLATRGEALAAVQAAAQALDEARAREAALAAQRAALGPDIDPTALVAALALARDTEATTGPALLKERAEADAAATEQARRQAGLTPADMDLDTLEKLAVPPREAVEALREAHRAHEERQRDLARRHARETKALALLADELERLARDETVVSPAALAETRARRTRLWARVRARWLDEPDVPPEGEENAAEPSPPALADALESATTAADALADRRFAHAEAAARFAECQRRHQAQHDAVALLAAEADALSAEAGTLEAQARALWHALPDLAPDPDRALAWLDGRAALLAVAARERDARQRLLPLEAQRAQAGDEIRRALAALPATAPATDLPGLAPPGLDAAAPLPAWIEHARARLARLERLHDQAQRLRAEQAQAAAETARRQAALNAARAAWTTWEHDWHAALGALGLDPATPVEGVASRLDTLESLRQSLDEARRLGHELARLEAEHAALNDAIAALGTALATPDGAPLPLDPDATLDGLRTRLAEARAQAHEHARLIRERQRQQEEHAQASAERHTVLGGLRPLLDAAGVEDPQALAPVIALSDAARAVDDERAAVLARLKADGDGIPLPDLIAECAGVDPDEAAAGEAAQARRMEDIEHALRAARDHDREARQAFQALGGDGLAARAAADKAAALADMNALTAEVIRLRTASVLLNWGIERFRRDRQGPLLHRAGALFATLTGGSFAGLGTTYDDDQPGLEALRADGRPVPLDGLSAGTGDQLYLALRVAAIEHAVPHAPALPFIADDLFMTFDDTRAGAGFRVLAELARRTQVLFFTHHPHLARLAVESLPEPVRVVSLPGSPR
ncbi:YhaN family protein [Pararhodospirillum oryzae]|uniref:YhaN AAA domain-containing protein n=1 Tax=Pararhodospirillum oryzae TaxID=478448 RepID=A0A512H9G4_9PROT|nr:YhaN family protein [Pararhodospirillum oryzae]GEO82030.1 hypothetical protein ROR02_21610 [Pararhodospirillum oryzae]